MKAPRIVATVMAGWAAAASLIPSATAHSPAPLARSRRSPALASALSIVPGTGQHYIGQAHKGAACLTGTMMLTAVCVPIAPLNVIVYLICIAFTGLDAFVLARRLDSGGTLQAWQWFWSKELAPAWTVAEVRRLGRTEQPIGREAKVLDNSRSASKLIRTLNVTREWSYTYTVEHERACKTVDTKSIALKDGAQRTRSVEDALRNRLSYAQGERQVYEEHVQVEVPPFRKVTAVFRWKHVLEVGVVVLESQVGERVELPFSIVVGITFDQEHVDDA